MSRRVKDFQSYLEYLEHRASGDRCSQYLLSYVKDPKPKGKDDFAHLFVLDCDGEKVKQIPMPASDVAICPPETKMRIVMLCYSTLHAGCSSIFWTLALQLEIPPFFLTRHLNSVDFSSSPIEMIFGFRDEFQKFPCLQIRSEDLGNSTTSFLLFKPKIESNASIWLIIDRDSLAAKPLNRFQSEAIFSSNHQLGNIRHFLKSKSRTLVDDLTLFSPQDCQLGIDMPLNFLKPSIKFYLKLRAASLAYHRSNFDETVKLSKFKDIDEISLLVSEYDETLESVQYFRDAFEALAQETQSTSLPFVDTIRSNTEILLQRASRMRTSMRDMLTIQVSLTQLEESRKSIEETQSTQRITQLAYIYLPLAFGSSLFGMNVPQFTNASLTSYIATSIILLLLSLLLAVLFQPIQKVLHWYTYRHGVIPALKKMIWRFPLCTVILYAYLLSNGSEATRELMSTMEIFNFIDDGMERTGYIPFTPAKELLSRKHGKLGRIWIAAAKHIYIATDGSAKV